MRLLNGYACILDTVTSSWGNNVPYILVLPPQNTYSHEEWEKNVSQLAVRENIGILKLLN